MKPMSIKQRAYIRALAEDCGWTETEALDALVKAAQGAHHATNESQVARSGRSIEELTARDAYKMIAWLRKQNSTSAENYEQHLIALGGTPMTDEERQERQRQRREKIAEFDAYEARAAKLRTLH